MVARVGHFALISLKVRAPGALPRKSTTRRLLSQPNEDIDPQSRLFQEEGSSRGATELAYLGCMVSVPCNTDPTVPAELALGVMSAAMDRWLSWISIPRACASLQGIDAGGPTPIRPVGELIPDKAFPKLRVPNTDDQADRKK